MDPDQKDPSSNRSFVFKSVGGSVQVCRAFSLDTRTASEELSGLVSGRFSAAAGSCCFFSLRDVVEQLEQSRLTSGPPWMWLGS